MNDTKSSGGGDRVNMDKDQFIESIRKNKGQMYAVAYSMVHNHSDAEDVVQDALLNAYKKLHTLKDDQKFLSWMMQIIVNQSKMYIRKNAKLQYLDDMDGEKEQLKNQEDDTIWDSVMALKSEFSTVIILYYADGYKVKEISEIMGIPEGTVKSRLAKARELLKKELEE